MAKILIVNNAEPGITEFTTPVEQIVTKTGALQFLLNMRVV